jgi:hypothetical protein
MTMNHKQAAPKLAPILMLSLIAGGAALAQTAPTAIAPVERANRANRAN